MVRAASFHLVRESGGRMVVAVWRLATDRFRLRRLDGVVMAKVLGTGRGASTGPSFDPRRRAYFVVWRDDASLERFVRDDPLRLADADEAWWCGLRTRAVRGRWGRWRPAPLRASTESGSPPGHGSAPSRPVATLTRAAIRPRAVATFLRESRHRRTDASTATGCRAVVGIGDVPIVRLGTFAVWDDASAVAAFAASLGHRAASTAARSGDWFGDELFATFDLVDSGGRWDGRDPAGAGRPVDDRGAGQERQER